MKKEEKNDGKRENQGCKGQDFAITDFLFGANSVFIEELYKKYTQDPNSVDLSWRDFFCSQTNLAQSDFIPVKTTSKIIVKDIAALLLTKAENKNHALISTSSHTELALRAQLMINAYRQYGHYLVKLDPLELEIRKTHDELNFNPENFGFEAKDLEEEIDIANYINNVNKCSIKELQEILEKIYAKSIATEFAHVEDDEERKWLYDQLETASIEQIYSCAEKKNFLQDLVEVEGFEQYLHTKFPGAKRFSIEGGDMAILSLNFAIKQSALKETQEAVIGLAHRGRLSTLTKVMKKPYRAIFAEFFGNSAFPEEFDIAGDVKYHMGFSSDRIIESCHNIHLSLTPNPSHLEAVNSVVAGKVRAKQDILERNRKKVMGILVHGDAAFCGQGVVAECLVMSGLAPYDVGGIFHLVINNQVGFTANPKDGRTGRYCTEVAKMAGAPIIHVNGDDVEAVIMATKLACDYRSKFLKDIVLDIVCYRKYGHNEGDEPMYTQGPMYNIIKNKQTIAAIYAQKLQAESVIEEGYYEQLKINFKHLLDEEFSKIDDYKPEAQCLQGHWANLKKHGNTEINTGLDKIILKELAVNLATIPATFPINPKLKKLFETRIASLNNNEPIDWAIAEQLAFATLLQANIPVRITGQDAARGTFSHRHSVIHSQQDNAKYEPLNNISADQAFFEVADSNLSEYGVLGFEYGYSLVNPHHLVIWEAQFGDFCNGAQIIFDQFISSSETKWLRMSGLVCLLPHGMEGQGPEHSSARLERFLQLCAEDNIQVVYPTTPASIFHLLRRQVLRDFRKPLIIMSPKSLLRHKLAVSSLAELDANTKFQPVLDEVDSDIKAKKIIFCTGKVYYDLLEKRRNAGIKNIAIIRLEQLYPFPAEQITSILAKYPKELEFIWCQEEPQNMGAWQFIQPLIEEVLQKDVINNSIIFVGREAASSPAAGYLYVHNKQQQILVNKALAIE